MKKKLTLLILLLPFTIMAQTGIGNNGTITIDFGKKRKQQQEDTTKQQQPADEDEEAAPKQKKEKKQTSTKQEEEKWDFKKEGLFKALFHAGFNGAQIDGDSYAGYNYLGFQGGIGAMVRFHKHLSVSMELNYTMKGAKQAFIFNAAPPTLMKYMVQWDYIEIPVSLNIHDKNLIMFSLGLSVAEMIRDKERDEQGEPYLIAPPNGFPRKFDLCGFAGLHFIIKKHFAIGGKFSYSFLPVRGSYSITGPVRVSGQYNNVITIRFMYIMDAVKKKK